MLLHNMYSPDRIVMQVGCLGYEEARRLVSDLLSNMAAMAGTGPEMAAGPPESAMGWTFYQLAVSKDFVRRLAGVPGVSISAMKGDTLDDKFVVWLNMQLAARAGKGEGEVKVQVRLLSDLRSSRFGLF